jgi:biopolymer transport protein TolR
MGMSSGGGRGKAVSDINVTPLVDVMLVLLIIFMVTAPLITQGVDVDLPKTKASSLEGTEKKTVLTITKEKKIFIGSNSENPIPYEQLVEKQKHNEKLQAEKEIYLHADQKLEYGFVVQVMARVQEAGITKLGMVTDPLEGAAQPVKP